MSNVFPVISGDHFLLQRLAYHSPWPITRYAGCIGGLYHLDIEIDSSC